ncbi:MAG: hypothetical protein ABS68_10450 [Niastella sp. SCN 39-18]|nr:MAG: hypothetical protein ABS68_10450 [Niastella sp. SCN 39-18]
MNGANKKLKIFENIKNIGTKIRVSDMNKIPAFKNIGKGCKAKIISIFDTSFLSRKRYYEKGVVCHCRY